MRCWFCRYAGKNGIPVPDGKPLCEDCHKKLSDFQAWLRRGGR